MLAVVTAALGVAALAASTASAQSFAFRACKGNPTVGCATLQVPLDHADPAKGTLSLAVQRRKASGTSKGVIIMLAGGPGQSAGTLRSSDLLPSMLPNWDYVVFDQRGTGKTGALRCAAFDTPNASLDNATQTAQCADQIGPNRVFYTSHDSVLDIESLRVALGASRIALGGISYGTYVTQYYAQEFPGNVSHLILDSVVDPDGNNGIDLSSFAAVAPMLQRLCAGSLCKGITSDPVADLAALVQTSNPAGLRGTGGNTNGTPTTGTIGGPRSPGDLPAYLFAGDLNPHLRGLWPGAIRAAVKGDMGPLIRLAALAEYGDSAPVTSISDALFMSTSCADDTAIWASNDPRDVRTAKYDAAFAALGDGAFAPFAIVNAKSGSKAEGCIAWPETALDPLVPGPLPAVPTIVLSGGQDLRTPTSGAVAVAQRSPSATVVVAPGWGHDLTDNLACADEQVARMLAGRPVQAKACRSVTVGLIADPFPAPAATISSLSPTGAKGNPGRVAHAVRFSIQDGLSQANAGLDAGLTGIQGVRSGFMSLSGTTAASARFKAFSDTKGVAITGRLSVLGNAITGRVSVNGPGRLDGSIELHNQGGRIWYSGSIGGTTIFIKVR
jgi:pimeloyl-ACP methyl ester carboxylesterase